MDSCFSCLAAWLPSVEGFTTRAKTSQDTTTLECLCSVNSLAVFLSNLVVRPPAILSVNFWPGWQPHVSNQNHAGVLAALAHWATFDNVCSRWPEQHQRVFHTSLGVYRVIGKISGIETIRIPLPVCWMSKWFLGMEILSCQPLLASQSHKLWYVVNQMVTLNKVTEITVFLYPQSFSIWLPLLPTYTSLFLLANRLKILDAGYPESPARWILVICNRRASYTLLMQKYITSMTSLRWCCLHKVLMKKKHYSHNHFRVFFHQRWSLVRHAVHLLRQKLAKA